MKKLTLTFITIVFFIPLIFVTTTVLSGGHGPPKEWKGEGKKYNNPFVIFDESCVSNSTTIAYDKNAAHEATKLVKDFFISTFAL